MNRKKFVTILASLVGVWLLIMAAASLLGSDGIRPKLESAIRSTTITAQLSEVAAQNSSSFELQTAAQTITTISTSDAVALNSYYQKRFNNEPPKIEKVEIVTTLNKTNSGAAFDEAYKSLAKLEIEQNLVILKELLNESKSQELKELLNQVIANQQSHQQLLGG